MNALADLASRSYSGASIELVQDEENLLVVKHYDAHDPRSMRCIQKQVDFQPLVAGNIQISSAKVLEVASQDSKIRLVMQYSDGMSGESFCVHGDRSSAKTLERSLSVLIERNVKNSISYRVSGEPFLSKLAQVIDKSGHNPQLLQVLNATYGKISNFFEASKSVDILIGPCHGDLTLSNMILNPADGLVLIDFLDTFLESPLQDVAKLIQDLRFGWSSRHKDSNLKIKSDIFNHAAYPSYAQKVHNDFSRATDILVLMCLARIAPYVREDPVTLRWLSQSLVDRLQAFNPVSC